MVKIWICIEILCSNFVLLHGMLLWKLTSQIVTFEHEGNWGKALEYYDLQVRSEGMLTEKNHRGFTGGHLQTNSQPSTSSQNDVMRLGKPYKGLIRSLQQIGCTHVLDLYCQGLTSRKELFQHDSEFAELQVCVCFLLDIHNHQSYSYLLLYNAVWSCLACRKLGFFRGLWVYCSIFKSTANTWSFQWKLARVIYVFLHTF